jgi:FKBP12-rapamycin complex-associated protein
VALKSPIGDRKEAADALMASLRQHDVRLMDQALLVSQELIRVAISWEESWHWALEDASRQCFGEGNIQGMIETLLPLHEMIEKPVTVREAAFVENYKYELKDAYDCLLQYKRIMTQERGFALPTSKKHLHAMQQEYAIQLQAREQALLGQNQNQDLPVPPPQPFPEDSLITQAWDLYYPIFKRINSQLPHMNNLDLQTCSPALFTAQDLDLGVPGTYSVTGQAVKIKSFHAVVSIIRSKQRPRKLRIFGEDGQEFVFLLKGHEDLRQDERAMQLFGLVNALLYYDRRTNVNSQDLQIQRYPVMPLSPTVGLIGWVPNCDTLHDLIRSYRDSRKIMLDVEHRLILQVAPGKSILILSLSLSLCLSLFVFGLTNSLFPSLSLSLSLLTAKLYDSLPLMHKLEVFEHAMTYTQGEDLAKILW